MMNERKRAELALDCTALVRAKRKASVTPAMNSSSEALPTRTTSSYMYSNSAPNGSRN